MRALPGLLLEELVGERDRRLEPEAVGRGGESPADRAHHRRGRGDPLEDRSTINALRHDDLLDATRLILVFFSAANPPFYSCIKA